MVFYTKNIYECCFWSLWYFKRKISNISASRIWHNWNLLLKEKKSVKIQNVIKDLNQNKQMEIFNISFEYKYYIYYKLNLMLLQHYVPLREYVTVLKDVLKSPSIASTVATKDAEGNETRLVEAKITQSYFIITCLKMITKT